MSDILKAEPKRKVEFVLQCDDGFVVDNYTFITVSSDIRKASKGDFKWVMENHDRIIDKAREGNLEGLRWILVEERPVILDPRERADLIENEKSRVIIEYDEKLPTKATTVVTFSIESKSLWEMYVKQGAVQFKGDSVRETRVVQKVNDFIQDIVDMDKLNAQLKKEFPEAEKPPVTDPEDNTPPDDINNPEPDPTEDDMAPVGEVYLFSPTTGSFIREEHGTLSPVTVLDEATIYPVAEAIARGVSVRELANDSYVGIVQWSFVDTANVDEATIQRITEINLYLSSTP